MMPQFEDFWRAEIRENTGGYVRTKIQRPVVPGDRFGGSVRFDRVPDGPFLTTSWEIRGVRLGYFGSFGAGGADFTPIAYERPTSARLVALVPEGG
jgi:hypothetical protein